MTSPWERLTAAPETGGGTGSVQSAAWERLAGVL